jgi:hypothetical protein
MKHWMFLLGITLLLLSACGTLTVDIEYGNVTATPSLDPSGDRELGWVTLTGTLRDSSGTALGGEGVYCQPVSNYPVGLCTGTRYTGADGRFSFGPIFLHASDTIVLWALASGHELREMTRPGLDVWKQPDFEFVFPVPPTPPSAPLAPGDLGWITIAGTVRDASGSPLPGETVYCQYVTEDPFYVYSNRHTNTRGGFSCDSIFLRDTDRISVQVLAGSYAGQEIVRSGSEIRQNPVFDFVFTELVTPTPHLSPSSLPPVLATDTASPADLTAAPSGSARLPDLVVESLYLEMEGRQGGCVRAYTPYGIRVRVRNTGPLSSGPFMVDLNGVRQRMEGELSAGQFIELHFPGTVESGRYLAYVDAAGEVAERAEDNNTLSFQAPTPTPPPLCTPTPTSSP